MQNHSFLAYSPGGSTRLTAWLQFEIVCCQK